MCLRQRFSLSSHKKRGHSGSPPRVCKGSFRSLRPLGGQPLVPDNFFRARIAFCLHGIESYELYAQGNTSCGKDCRG